MDKIRKRTALVIRDEVRIESSGKFHASFEEYKTILVEANNARYLLDIQVGAEVIQGIDWRLSRIG